MSWCAAQLLIAYRIVHFLLSLFILHHTTSHSRFPAVAMAFRLVPVGVEVALLIYLLSPAMRQFFFTRPKPVQPNGQ